MEIDPRTQTGNRYTNLGGSWAIKEATQLAGTRAGGFVLTRQEAAGKWAAAYSLFSLAAVDF